MIWIVFGVLLLVLIGLFLFAMLYEFISKKLEFQPILKKYLVHVLVVIFLFALITPLILYFFGLFNKDRALQNSDILGYYGAVIGGIVTVLGVYWTLNYESKKSKEEREFERQKEEEKRKLERERFQEEREYERQKEEERRKLERKRFQEEREYELQKVVEERTQERERFQEERRKDSLPILRFTHSPNFYPVVEGVTRNLPEEKEIYKIILNTSDESSVVKYLKNGIERGKANEETIFRIIETGILEIQNVGLGAAILSNVYLYRKDTKEIVKNLQDNTKDKYIIKPNTLLVLKTYICSNDFSKDDVLIVDFRDIYSNKYRYTISFENNFPNEEAKTIINDCSVDVLPTQIKK